MKISFYEFIFKCFTILFSMPKDKVLTNVITGTPLLNFDSKIFKFENLNILNDPRSMKEITIDIDKYHNDRHIKCHTDEIYRCQIIYIIYYTY